MTDAPSPTIEVTVDILVDDIGQCTAGNEGEDLWSIHEGKGGYNGLQLYTLTLTLPRPAGHVELTAELSAPPAKDATPITLTVQRKQSEDAA